MHLDTEQDSFLSRMFMIFDEESLSKESAGVEDIIMFFHPSHVDRMKQIQAVMITAGMIGYSTNFTQSPMTILEMTRTKAASIGVGKYIMVLTGSGGDSNELLENQIHLVWNAFQFYNGSFDRLLAIAKYDPIQVKREIIKAATNLIPVIDNFHTSPLKFTPMPYMELDPIHENTSSHFVMAWEFLNVFQENQDISDSLFGGALFYNNKVVCTKFNVSSTRWIVNLIDSTGNTEEYGLKRQYYIAYETIDSLVNLVGAEKLEEMLSMKNEENNPEYINDEGEQIEETELVPGRVRVNLCIISLQFGMSLALMYNSSSKDDTFIKSVDKVIRDNSELCKNLGELLQSVIASDLSLECIPLTNSREDRKQGRFADSSNCYNFFTFNELTDMQMSSK
eukprot:TRINITY_DN3241_c0_g1_i2.p1 TRINITY_DN3241_c0_g1~~TRINITY_DN3241_c0_g1_i2.p1  ORF type:complete len:403 (-),score=77.74 TRINITY_DN3241_c0_g1_i2:306-1487(-)